MTARLSWFPVRHLIEHAAGRGLGIRWLGHARAFGFDAVEVHELYLRTPEAVDDVEHGLRKNQLELSMITAAPDFTHTEEAGIEAEQAAMKRVLEIAERLGCTRIRVTAGPHRAGQELADAVARAASALTEVAERAETRGIRCCLENHFRDRAWPDNMVDITFHNDVFLTLLQKLEGTPVRVNYDTAQPVYAKQDPVGLLATVADRVVHVHAGERRWGEREHLVIGTGDVDWEGVFAILAEQHFDGFVSVEDGSKAGDNGTRRAVEFLNNRLTKLEAIA